MTREKTRKGKGKGRSGKSSLPPATTTPPESGPPTLENIEIAKGFLPPEEEVTEAASNVPEAEPGTVASGQADEPNVDRAVDAGAETRVDHPPPPPPLDAPDERSHAATDDDGHGHAALADILPGHDTDEARDGAPETNGAGDGEGPIEDARELSQTHLRGLLEALVFASDKPMKLGELARLASAPAKQVKEAMAALRAEYAPRGIVLDEVAGGWLFRTSAQYAPFVRELAGGRPVKLSRAQLETLAIAAYRQPITRPEIDEIRGVDSGATLKLLLERDLVRILGKKDEPGRPLLYGTTTTFLEFFNMKSLRDLPTLREFTELSDESRRVAEAELGDVLPDMLTMPAPALSDGPEAATGVTDRASFAADDGSVPTDPSPAQQETLEPSEPSDERPWPEGEATAVDRPSSDDIERGSGDEDEERTGADDIERGSGDEDDL